MTSLLPDRCPRLLVAAIVACLAGHAFPATAQETLGPRVRSGDPAVAALLARATEGSATFRRELEAIQATNGLVYIEKGPCGRHGVRACLLNSVTTGGGYRLLRVKVDMQRCERDIMASLAHELQHVIEVLSDPYVTDGRRMFRFYQREAPTSRGDMYETQAAINAGVAVYKELARRK
jgi:hypothetical protein